MLDHIKYFLSENSLLVAFFTAATNVVVDQIGSISTPIIAVLSIIVLAFTAFIKYEEWVEKRHNRLERLNKNKDEHSRDNQDLST